MDRWKKGKLAKSLAGHDKDKVYIITEVEGAYVYLADGRIRTLENPKKKKKKHVQIINTICDMEAADDVKLKRILKEYAKHKSEVKEEM